MKTIRVFIIFSMLAICINVQAETGDVPSILSDVIGEGATLLDIKDRNMVRGEYYNNRESGIRWCANESFKQKTCYRYVASGFKFKGKYKYRAKSFGGGKVRYYSY